MFYSSINTDFAAYQTKVAFGLTKRQIICFLTAAVIGLPAYYFTKDHIGTDMAGILMILIMAPLFVIAMYKKNGQNPETVLKNYIKEQFFSKKVRMVRTTPLLAQVSQTADYASDKKNIHPSDDKATKMLRDYAFIKHGIGPKKKNKTSAADSLPFERMYENGLCYIGEGRYSIMLKLDDVNYHQLDDADQKDFWSSWCMFLNTLDHECDYQLCFYDHKADTLSLSENIMIKKKDTNDSDHERVTDRSGKVKRV